MLASTLAPTFIFVHLGVWRMLVYPALKVQPRRSA
jgi:hypothetical protein